MIVITHRQQLIDPEQIKKYTQERVEKQFEDKSIPQKKVDLSEIEERFEQQRVEFDETMNYMEIKYSNQRPAIQVYVYDNNSTEAIRSECSIHDKNNDTLIIAWERGYRGYILVNKFE